MTSPSTVRAARPFATRTAAHDRLFYSTMAVVMALCVFAGFARTYYLRLFSGGPTVTIGGLPFTPLVHLHGALFTAWALLFGVQTTLVAQHRVSVHRRLGIAGAVLAATMVVAGITIDERGRAPMEDRWLLISMVSQVAAEVFARPVEEMGPAVG